MLWLGLLTRDSGIPASHRLNIKDEALALDFDLAVSLRLLHYDQKQEYENKKFWVKLVTGETIEDPDDVLGAEIIASDRYADKNTEVW
jgi:hypothetical protein